MNRRILLAWLWVALCAGLIWTLSGESASGKPFSFRLTDDEGVLQVEPGYSPADLAGVRDKWSINLWPQKDLYFGGAHVVMADGSGWGDSRRGGHFISS